LLRQITQAFHTPQIRRKLIATEAIQSRLKYL